MPNLLMLNKYQKIPKNISPQLDSIRGLSALIVLFAHANQVFIAPISMQYYGIAGLFAQAAVMIFFVLSGFLIGKSLTRNMNKNGSLNLSEYLIDRFNRIYPPLIFSILLVVVLYFLAPFFFTSNSNFFYFSNNLNLARPGFIIDLNSVFSSLFLINGFLGPTISSNPPLWSLSYEVWYYLLAGLAFKFNKKYNIILFFIITIILGYLSKGFIIFSLVWFSGLILCLIHNNNLKIDKFISFFKTISLFSLFVFAYIYLTKFHPLPKLKFFSPDLAMLLFRLSVGFYTTLFLYEILNNKLKFITFFRSSSKYSYTLYIIHFPIFLFSYGVFENLIKENISYSLFLSLLLSLFVIFLSKIIASKLENIKILDNSKKKFESKK
jgi:peptidoglycan/LPS O-acetylase OafA/YrhL